MNIKEERLEESLMNFIEGELREKRQETLPEPDIYKILAEEEAIEMYEVNFYDKEMVS